MIYTVTFNPSLDYAMDFDEVVRGGLNRAKHASITAGGKGINVSKVLTGLGVENLMLGFVAGFTGDEIERSLSREGYRSEFIRLERGTSRINVKVNTGEMTELNAGGPEIPKNAVEKLHTQLDRLNKGDFLVLAGNIPEGMPEFTYNLIIDKMNAKGVKTVVDASGSVLMSSLQYSPFLIKPNRQEISELFSIRLSGPENAEKYLRQLQAKGAGNILLSLDKEGAVLLTEEGELFYRPAPEGNVINSVGAGDSMVAGFLWGYIETGDYREALVCAVSAGSASAFSHGFASGADIRALKGLLGI